MTANELRIGNWVYHEPSVNETTNGEFIVSEINVFDKNSINGLESSDVKPIPLTEEWLLRFGFEKTKKLYVKYFFGDYIGVHVGDFSVGTYTHKGIAHAVQPSCMFVHQLQNLYFALTGEELTLKQ